MNVLVKAWGPHPLAYALVLLLPPLLLFSPSLPVNNSNLVFSRNHKGTNKEPQRNRQDTMEQNQGNVQNLTVDVPAGAGGQNPNRGGGNRRGNDRGGIKKEVSDFPAISSPMIRAHIILVSQPYQVLDLRKTRA